MIVLVPTAMRVGRGKNGALYTLDYLRNVGGVVFKPGQVCGRLKRANEPLTSVQLDNISVAISEDPDCFLLGFEIIDNLLYAKVDFIDRSKAVVVSGGKFVAKPIFEFKNEDGVMYLVNVRSVFIERL